MARAMSAGPCVAGNLVGIGKAGGAFGKRTEGASTWTRGTAGYIPGGDNLAGPCLRSFPWYLKWRSPF